MCSYSEQDQTTLINILLLIPHRAFKGAFWLIKTLLRIYLLSEVPWAYR